MILIYIWEMHFTDMNMFIMYKRLHDPERPEPRGHHRQNEERKETFLVANSTVFVSKCNRIPGPMSWI